MTRQGGEDVAKRGRDRLLKTVLVVAFVLSAVVCDAQVAAARDATARNDPRGTTAEPDAAEAAAAPERSIEDLNLLGAAVTMPPLSDSLFGVASGFRRAMLGQGLLFRVNVIPRFSQNPSELNPYDRYYEARVYQRGTFRSRPTDVLSLIASYRNHSRYSTGSLVAQGATVWRSSSSLTGTYTLHVSRGDYLSLSLGYVRGPALSPRVPSALVFTANWSLYL